MKRNDFPKNFLWGTATAAYQIEGADLEDGKGPSIWTHFCTKDGAIRTGEDGSVGCDHYHQWDEDLELMKALGVNAYRFSISWPRVIPDGKGKPNSKGLDFYNRLVDGILDRGIEPMITLYHWDLPQVLQEQHQGWESRDTIDYFGVYAQQMFSALGDRVSNWITLNEPFCSSHTSYFMGEHAPGVCDAKRSFQVAHHLLLAHGKAVQAFRSEVPGGNIGLTNVTSCIEAASSSEEDKRAAFLGNQFVNDWFYATPIYGSYPSELSETLKPLGLYPEVKNGDFEIIREPIDFWGVNYYTRQLVKADPGGMMGIAHDKPRLPTTDMGWEIYPQGLTQCLKQVSEYGSLPLYVTENGCAEKDMVFRDKVHDEKRVKYIREHIKAVQNAINQGIIVKGYFLWSFLDNFEWAYGFSKRFGLVYVDFKDQERKRTPKDSYLDYQQFLTQTDS